MTAAFEKILMSIPFNAWVVILIISFTLIIFRPILANEGHLFIKSYKLRRLLSFISFVLLFILSTAFLLFCRMLYVADRVPFYGYMYTLAIYIIALSVPTMLRGKNQFLLKRYDIRYSLRDLSKEKEPLEENIVSLNAKLAEEITDLQTQLDVLCEAKNAINAPKQDVEDFIKKYEHKVRQRTWRSVESIIRHNRASWRTNWFFAFIGLILGVIGGIITNIIWPTIVALMQ